MGDCCTCAFCDGSPCRCQNTDIVGMLEDSFTEPIEAGFDRITGFSRHVQGIASMGDAIGDIGQIACDAVHPSGDFVG